MQYLPFALEEQRPAEKMAHRNRHSWRYTLILTYITIFLSVGNRNDAYGKKNVDYRRKKNIFKSRV